MDHSCIQTTMRYTAVACLLTTYYISPISRSTLSPELKPTAKTEADRRRRDPDAPISGVMTLRLP